MSMSLGPQPSVINFLSTFLFFEMAVKDVIKLAYRRGHRYATRMTSMALKIISLCSSPFDIPTKIAFNAWV